MILPVDDTPTKPLTADNQEELRSCHGEGVVRQDVVEAIRAELAAGVLEENIDLETVIDRLLEDL